MFPRSSSGNPKTDRDARTVNERAVQQVVMTANSIVVDIWAMRTTKNKLFRLEIIWSAVVSRISRLDRRSATPNHQFEY